ncbi:MAG: class I SAM-dependent methyltransferase [Oribacterium sp.]|nr:class I SAM-dependent methyltransferase [Oribacterium sp.]
MRKIPIEFYPVICETELCYERAEELFDVHIGIEELYIVDEKGRLSGVLSRKQMEENKSGMIFDSVCREPILIVANRYDMKMAEGMMRNTVFICSVPVIDRDGQIKYVYVKENNLFDKSFTRETELHTMDEYSRIVHRAFETACNRLGYQPYILTDIVSCGGNLWQILLDRIISVNDIEETTGTVLLAYIFDFHAKLAVERCLERNVSFITVNPVDEDKNAGITPYYKMDEIAYEVLRKESCYNSSYFDSSDFSYLFQAIRLTADLSGDYVEIGTYKGDSARAALSFMERSGIKRDAFFIDTYEGFSYDIARRSVDAQWQGSHTDTSMEYVQSRLKEFDGYTLIKSNIITDPFPKQIRKIAVCNIDVDMYEAVAEALEKTFELVVVGGVILAEDYGHTPALLGAHQAIDEFYCRHKTEIYGLYMMSGQFIMIKKTGGFAG